MKYTINQQFKIFKPHELDRCLSLLATLKLLHNKYQFRIINGQKRDKPCYDDVHEYSLT